MQQQNAMTNRNPSMHPSKETYFLDKLEDFLPSSTT